MFCPSCGTESTGLNYCNRCGANLSGPLAPPDLAPINLTKPILVIGSVVLFLTLGGFLMVLSAAASLAGKVAGEVPMAIVFFGMVTILTLDILLIRQLSKLINAALSPGGRKSEKGTIRAANTLQLPFPTTSRLGAAPSVTENTTRFFDNYQPAATNDPVPVPVKKTEQ